MPLENLFVLPDNGLDLPDLVFGQVWVNCHLVQAAEMPNGGFKHSGHGNDLSTEAIEGYTRVKHIMSLTGR